LMPGAPRLLPKPRVLTVNGRTFGSMAAAAKHHQVDRQLLVDRLSNGWSVEQALGLVRPPPRADHKPVCVSQLVFESLSDAAQYFGLSYDKARGRLSRGWSMEEAFGLAPYPPKSAGECAPKKSMHVVTDAQGRQGLVHDLAGFERGRGVEPGTLFVLRGIADPTVTLHGWQCRVATVADAGLPMW
jgi:hypothetical protein